MVKNMSSELFYQIAALFDESDNIGSFVIISLLFLCYNMKTECVIDIFLVCSDVFVLWPEH